VPGFSRFTDISLFRTITALVTCGFFAAGRDYVKLRKRINSRGGNPLRSIIAVLLR
jgi:hypothetical protein